MCITFLEILSTSEILHLSVERWYTFFKHPVKHPLRGRNVFENVFLVSWNV